MYAVPRSVSAAATTSLLYKPDERLLIEASLDYYYDDYGTAYFGVPLISAASARQPSDIVTNSAGLVVDKALRYQNYDVVDGLMDSDAYWLRTRTAYTFNEGWRFTNELGYYDAQRRWANSEDYTFSASSGLLNRTTTKIFHDQQFWMDRAFASWDGQIGGRRNRMSFGVEYSNTDFGTNRRFGTTSAVDPYAPVRGTFPDDTAANFPGTGSRVDFESQADVTAFFAENAFNLTPRWLWVGGLRYDDIRLDRAIVDLNTGALTAFEQDYDPLSWRLGTVFELAPSFQVYAQYSYAVTPIGALLLISQSNARFDLTTGDSVEAGIKSSFLDGRIALTASVYRLEQNDILTRDPVNPAITLQGGSQKAEGAELSWAARVTEHIRIDGNLAVLTTEFTKLVEAGGANRAGNRPANVPEQTATLNAYYRLPAWPLTLGVSAQHAGGFFTSNSNDYRVEGHTTLNASLSYDSPFGRWTLRGRNLTNELYADWSGFSATQVYLGAPRTVELRFTTRL